MHEPAHTELAAELDHDPRPLDVDALVLGSRRVVRVQRREVEDGVAARDRPAQPFAVEQVDPLVADLVPAGPQLAHHMAADEPARPRDVDAH
jgi:hypothetical protein